MCDNVEANKFIERINAHITLDGKNVLEIGCGNGNLLKIIADQHKVKYITGVDSMLSSWWEIDESKGTNWSIINGNAEQLCFNDSSFDAVISYAAFEHIGDIQMALSEIKRVLKPYGRFYTEFSPIWTSIVGHHFVASGENVFNPKHLELIPPWGHLYINEENMREHLISQTDDEGLINEILHFIYHSNIINRRSRECYVNAIINCGMIIKKYSETVSFNRLAILGIVQESELTYDVLQCIESAGYNTAGIGVHSMTVCLEKYQSI